MTDLASNQTNKNRETETGDKCKGAIIGVYILNLTNLIRQKSFHEAQNLVRSLRPRRAIG